MIDKKLISIWEVPKYINDGWTLAGLADLGECWIERITLIKGEANESI
jgi:hypothetical protein